VSGLQECRRGPEAFQHALGPGWIGLRGTNQQSVKGAKQVVQPEAGIVHMRLLVLEPEHRDPDLVEEGGPVDLFLQILDIECFHRACQRPEGGQVGPHRLDVKGSEAAVLADIARGRGRRRIEVPAQVEVGAVQVVSCGHRPLPTPVGRRRTLPTCGTPGR
jgi:hypothetical protein